jgi:predicted ATPase/DNA-binding CsgD family transcriptional regulator
MGSDMAVTHHAGTGRLPAETDEFVGRTAELGQIEELLRAARLVTLVGPGGVGKSRIAVRAAAAAQSRYPDGAYLAELSSLRDPALLPHTVSRALGLSEQAAGSPQDTLLAHLHEQRLLLILDTCEHLVDACADLAQAIIAEAPLVTVLATSREPLDVAGETTFAVRPLPITAPSDPALPAATPPGTRLSTPSPDGTSAEPPPFGSIDRAGGRGPGGAETAADDAVELFARRAAAAIPGFTVTDANRASVTRICYALDGIPLAIELAAGRLRDLTLAEISGRLDRRLSLLTGGRDGNGARHATARNVVAWSYETCTATERALWARLSLFPGVFDVDAAAEVCTSSELGGAAIFETIIGLVNKSVLVRVDPMTEADGAPPAFRMLDTVREFGAERLAAAGDGPGIRARLLARYLAMARRADKLGFGDHQPELFAGLSREHVSIRAALDFALEATPGQPSRERDGAELATRLWTYWVSSGLMSEGLYWLGKALDRVTSPCPQRAWAHAARCGLAAVHGSIDQAVADGRAAVELAKTLKLPQVAGRANVGLCLAYLMAGDLQAAERSGKAAERQLTSEGDSDGLIVLDAHLAALFQASGQPERGVSYYKRGIARFRDGSGERIYHGHLHLAGAFCYLELPGQEQECAQVLSLALLAKYSLNDVTGTAYGLELFGWLACAAGRHERAAWLLGAADPLWTKLGARLSNAASWQQRHADAVASTRSALGDDAWSGLFRAGSAHPLGQVVALAINNADTLSDPVQVDARPGAGALTDREREIAFLAAAGLSAAQVAAQLFLPPRAVEEHLASVFGKLGVTSAAQLSPWLGEPAPRLSGPR